MLHLYQSNRLEHLALHLAKLIYDAPLNNIFEKETVWVQSKGMGRYLNLYIAEHLGISANINFTLPASFIWQLMQKVVPDAPNNNIYNTNILSWRILELLQTEKFNNNSLIKHYLNSGDIAALNLANKIAKIYDQYLVYRPNWIDAWSEDKLLSLGENEDWQKTLWQTLIQQSNSPHRVTLWHELLDKLSSEYLPQRIHIFGLSSLAPMYLNLLEHLAIHTEVHLFTVNPSQEYWGDLIEAGAILKQPEDYQTLSLIGHPLLSSLGKQGQEFFDSLNELNIAQEAEYFSANTSNSLLALLQNDLLDLKLPEASELAKKYLQDKSIQIHSAHSPLRELQILKDQLLAILQVHPELAMNDIAVLTPNIEIYAPLIHAVFTQTGDETFLPFSITDTHFGYTNPILFAFEELVNFFQNRFEVEHILSLLEIPAIADKFQLKKHDFETIQFYIQKMNIHWGTDKNMRAQYGDNSDHFTWFSGFRRLALGLMLSSPQEQHHLWQGVVPEENSFLHTETLAQLMRFIDALHQTYLLWQTPCQIDEWNERLQNLIHQFFEPNEANNIATAQIEQLILELSQNIRLAQYEQPLSYDLMRLQLSVELNRKNDRNFLKGGITFCSMMPMRSLPFKVLCLLGLNDTEYPRDEKAINFDLMTQHPQKGDRSRRNDDRYLFLESMISAREILYLSYVGRNIQTNEELPPSPLVNELLEVLATMTGLTIETLMQQLIVKHPLQPFSPSYFQNQNENNLFSYQKQYANALNTSSQKQPSFWNLDIEAKEVTEVHLSDFLSFWRNPVRYWLRKNLGWQTTYLDETQQSDEPFDLNKQQERQILKQLIQDKVQHQSFENSARIFEAQDLFPAGELGKLVAENEIAKVKNQSIPEIFLEEPLPDLEFQLPIGKITLLGTLKNLYPSGIGLSQPHTPNAPEHLQFLLNHLILCAVNPEIPQDKQSFLFNTEKTLTLGSLPEKNAKELLDKWLDYYIFGQTHILPFFPRTHIATTQIYLKSKDKPDALKKAKEEAQKKFYGNARSQGEAHYYEENKLIFQDQEPLDLPMFWEMMEDLLSPLLQLEME